MRLPVCTIDASVVIALDHLDLLPRLSLLFSRVLLPKAVRTELFRRRLTKDRLRSILESYAFVEHCNEHDQGAVDIHLIERKAQGVQDRGEVETVVQALQLGADVLIDDTWGRELARGSGRECHGTFWILCRFHELGFASPAETRACFVMLLQRGIRLPWKDVNELLNEIGQEPISKAGGYGPAGQD